MLVLLCVMAMLVCLMVFTVAMEWGFSTVGVISFMLMMCALVSMCVIIDYREAALNTTTAAEREIGYNG